MGGWYLPQIFRGNRVGTPKAAPQGVQGVGGGPHQIKIMKFNPAGPIMDFQDGDLMKYGVVT